ncbi:MAG: trypsin-like peptidase domain-containing protein [bacterium]|nr:trypsin-like peptidase domain-containing protein [bacterium]MDE0289391.1 trypsin-like peptidase domain-containing protein [bacterium]MDE0439461.1 trypsin-like peptidase domain-containing protein [bacterium]
MAIGSALLAAAATTTALWLAGSFDREVVQITEVVEVREFAEVPEPQKTSPQLPDTTASSVPGPSPAPPDSTVATTIPLFAPTDLVAVVASRAIPSIVTVQNLDGEFGQAGSGSGVIIRSDGFIVTNHHVIDGADTLKVIMSDGLSYPAELVGSDSLMDIAVLKVRADDLPHIRFGSMERLRTGEPAIAVGNPLGLDGGPSVTAGVISAFDRSLVTNPLTGESLYGLLQTDAPITRGSSGGALLDVHGRLLGITTAIGLSDVGAEGLGFAVPANLVERIVDDLMSEGEVRHAFLGIRGSSAFSELTDGVESPLGVEVNLLEESAIGRAGAQDGDVIVALDGVPVRSMPLLVARLRSYRAGDSITVTVQRDDETLDLDMTLDRYPS